MVDAPCIISRPVFLSTLSWADLYTRNRVKQRSICTLSAPLFPPFFFFSFSFFFFLVFLRDSSAAAATFSKVKVRLAFRDWKKATTARDKAWTEREKEEKGEITRRAALLDF